jgi:hypothetical protein
MMCEECGEMGHMGVHCPMVHQDVNFVGNCNNGFHLNQGFHSGWNKPNFPFDNRQQGGNGQSFNRNEPSLRDIVRDQLRINAEFSKKLLANDKVLENIDSKINNFIVAVQNQLSFNKLLEIQIAWLASSLQYLNGVDFPGQPTTPVKENVKAVIPRSVMTTTKPKTSSKKTAPIELNEERSEAEAEVEAELRPEKEGKASPKDVSDTHLLPFLHQMKKPVEDEMFSRFVNVIRKMFANILMLDAMHVPTYAKYMKDILNQKRPIPETDKLFIAEKCSTTILDGLPDKMGDPNIPTISCLIGAQKFDQALGTMELVWASCQK